MTNMTKIDDYSKEILKSVPFQFRSRGSESGNIRKHYIELGKEMQEIEDCLFDFINTRFLADATKNMLDRNGNTVEQPRPISGPASTDDNIYKALIYAKIAQNTSHGTVSDILQIMCQLKAQNVKIKEFYPAEIEITYDSSNTFLSSSEILEILRAVTAEITINLIETSSTPFGFDGDPTAFGFSVGELSGG